jgi:hypothetical protein
MACVTVGPENTVALIACATSATPGTGTVIPLDLLSPLGPLALAVRERVDFAAFGSQDFGERGVGSGERGVDGEGSCRGDAIGEAYRRALAMVAARADA